MDMGSKKSIVANNHLIYLPLFLFIIITQPSVLAQDQYQSQINNLNTQLTNLQNEINQNLGMSGWMNSEIGFFQYEIGLFDQQIKDYLQKLQTVNTTFTKVAETNKMWSAKFKCMDAQFDQLRTKIKFSNLKSTLM